MATAPWPWDQLIEELTGKWGWMLILTVISCIGFVGMTVAQFVKCLWTKNTTSLNKFFTIILPITNTLITLYDILLFVIVWYMPNPEKPDVIIFSWTALIPAVINGLISAYGTMILKVKHIRAAKKLGLTELQHYEKYLKPKAMSTKKALNKKK